MELPAPLLSQAEYDAVSETHQRPYVVELDSGPGQLLLYGSEHTGDPLDPQIADITERWKRLQPTVTLVEGRLGFLLQGLQDPVATYGEMGQVYALARAGGIPAYTWELPLERELPEVLKQHPREQVSLFYVLRPYFGARRGGRPEDPEAFVEEFRRKRASLPGLEGTLASVADIDRIWKRDFPQLPDWRDVTDEQGWPGYLGQVGATVNAVRDHHFASLIIDLLQRGERVFAIAGSSHAVKLAPALRGLTQR